MNGQIDDDYPWSEEFIYAIETENIDKFKDLLIRSGRLWPGMKTMSGNTILQETIRYQKVRLFRYLLQFCDVEYLEILNDNHQTALTLAIIYDKYLSYVPYLVEKYDTIPRRYDGSLLDWTIRMDDFDKAEYLLKRATDPNFVAISDGCPPLHRVLARSGTINTFEFLFMLLFYGADASVVYQKRNTFEIAVLREKELSHLELELLFEYTFDEHGNYQINFTVLLVLAKIKSSLFNRLLEYNIKFVNSDRMVTYCGTHNVEILLALEIVYFEIILKRYSSLVCDSLLNYDNWASFWNYKVFKVLNCNFVEKLNRFLEIDTTVNDTIVNSTAGVGGFHFLDRVCKLEESVATEIIIFLSLYSLQIPQEAFDLVYESYGYCDLFKFLLHMDYVEGKDNQGRSLVIVSLVRDVHKDIFWCMQKPALYSATYLFDVLDFFANSKLKQFVYEKIQDQDLKVQEQYQKRLEAHQVPSLVELGRDVFRQHLINTCLVKSTKQFYCLVGNLNINNIYKQIITLEKKLY